MKEERGGDDYIRRIVVKLRAFRNRGVMGCVPHVLSCVDRYIVLVPVVVFLSTQCTRFPTLLDLLLSFFFCVSFSFVSPLSLSQKIIY